MENIQTKLYTAFIGHQKVSSGELSAVALSAKKHIDNSNTQQPILIFDNQTSTQVEVDFRGSTDDLKKHIALLEQALFQEKSQQEESQPKNPAPKSRSGRPKLGVVAREVTLLPRHWDWLKSQRGGASATLRRLVEQARSEAVKEDKLREQQTAVYRFMTAIGGDLSGFEEAMRSLYAFDENQFLAQIDAWPQDVRAHIIELAKGLFSNNKN